MNKRIISAAVSLAMLVSAAVMPTAVVQAAEAKTPQYQTKARQMEKLNRGLIAAYRTQDSQNVDKTGVYLSWRLLGDEPLETQEFDIYKNGEILVTTTGAKGTNYVDETGTTNDTYKVVKAGTAASEVEAEPAVTPQTNHVAGSSQYTNLANSFIYEDIRLERPADSNGGHYYSPDRNTEGGANDASVGDLDGDGDYEIVLKWDPTNSKDAAGGDTTGRTYIDAYEIDPTNTDPAKNANGHLYKWRIDLGPHVRAGAHENPFLVYDFNGDGAAEIVSITGIGATDGLGQYVTLAGDTEEIKSEDNSKTYLRKGKNIGPEYYTIFDGGTGKALVTTAAIPIGPDYNAETNTYGPEDGSYFGDAKMNRSSRYLASVAYLDGVHPSIIMGRGYYNRAMIRAYTWDGTEMAMQWEHNGDKKGTTLYGQGNHNMSVGDIDNDGKDEIVYGSAALDDDGKTVLGNTQLGHGDAMHMSDFNNDGVQEVFSVKEDSPYFKQYAEDLRVASTGKHFWDSGKIAASDDNGRGVMDNIDDAYAKSEYDKGNKNVMALGWSSGLPHAHGFNGDDVNPANNTATLNKNGAWEGGSKPASAGNGSFDNFLVYWDGDLSRELLDSNIIQKYDAANGWTTRFWGENDSYTLTGGTTNNYSKRNPSLVADLWGDWREEIIMPVGKGQSDTPVLRIFTSTLPTDYRLTTLMHDSQYRLAIAWQNSGYNQPPHQSYYIGSIALATDASGNALNYLAPAVPYTKVIYDAPSAVAVTGINIVEDSVTVEKGKTVTVDADITPEDATKKGIAWTSSDTNVATVSNGVIKGVAPGTATIKATTKGTAADGTTTFSDECEVTVFATPVTGVSLSERVIELGLNNKIKLEATVYPDNATDKDVTWESEDEGVATVGTDGTVTGVGYGKTKVVAITNDGGKTAECIVNVKPMSIVDATGEDVFVTTNTDAETTLGNATATSGTLSHKAANTGGEMHKDFNVVDKGTAKLSFHLTTGGIKGIGAANEWKWTGHEYTMGIKLADENGDNIITVYQPYKEKAKDLMSQVRAETAETVTKSGWTNSGNVAGNIQGSAKRWVVDVEFDYNSDTCTITVNGAGKDGNNTNSWEPQFYDGKMVKTFSLNGAKFKTLQCYTTKDGDGTITASPAIDTVSYASTEQVSGNSNALYERGVNTEWSEADLTDWTQTNTETAELALDSKNGRIWYNPLPPGPGTEYSAEKTFDVTAGAIVSYDVDWYFGSAVARDGNFEYIQFGDKLRLGWTNGYKMLLSTDGGTTYGENAIFTGTNTTYTKKVQAQFDTTLKTVTLSFDGKQIYSGTYSDTDEVTADGANLVKFGFTRAGEPPAWAVPNGIDSIRVAQFVAGEETPDINCIRDIAVDKTDAKTVGFRYGLVDEFDSVTIVAALYGDEGELLEVKTKPVDSPEKDKYLTDSITFDSEAKMGNVKVFVWDTLNGQKPIAYIMN